MAQITLSANHSKGPQQAGEMDKQESPKVQQSAKYYTGGNNPVHQYRLGD